MKKDVLFIEGLGGKRTLAGEISVRGAKNDMLKIMAASLLFEDTVHITNVPRVGDVRVLFTILEKIGARGTQKGTEMSLAAPTQAITTLDEERAKKLRASVSLIGPLLARYGSVSFPHPGGCVIGARPIDLFIETLQEMGASYSADKNLYHFSVPPSGLRGADIFLDIASVGVTETVMMAAVLAKGTTVIRNAAMEPEIQNLARYLASCGAHIEGIGTPVLSIVGGGLLRAQGRVYKVIPDRIEAGSFAILAALAGQDVHITNINPDHLGALLSLFHKAGVNYHINGDTLAIKKPRAPYRAVNVRTQKYPGFSTDLQAPMVVFLTQTHGEGLVFETLFEGRLRYTDDLVRMGADITMFDPHRVLVRGPRNFVGKRLEAPDLRAGLAYIIAGTIAEGNSEIHSIEYIDRGYEDIEGRLARLGVSIRRRGA